MKVKDKLTSGMIHSLKCISDIARYDEYYLHFVLFPLIREQSKTLQKLELWDALEDTGISLWQYPLFLQQEYIEPMLFENHTNELVSLCRNLVYGDPLVENSKELSFCSQFTAQRLDKLFNQYVGNNPHE